MTMADFYIESHINQFYRILFFVQELQANLLLDSAALSSNLVTPEASRAILSDDKAYSDYLVTLRNNLSRNSKSNGLGQELAGNGREEDLILLSATALVEVGPGLPGRTSRTTTTTTAATSTRSTTTPGYDSRDRQSKVQGEGNKHGQGGSTNRYDNSSPSSPNRNKKNSVTTKYFNKKCLLHDYNLTQSRVDKIFPVCSLLKQQQQSDDSGHFGYIVDNECSGPNALQLFSFEKKHVSHYYKIK